MEDFNLEKYGDEGGEMAEIKQRLGWRKPKSERAKFYDAAGSDTWYFFAYGDAASRTSNRAVIYRGMKSIDDEMVILKSGPSTSVYPTEMEKNELAQALMQFRTEDPNTIFGQREASRFTRKMGMGQRPPGLGVFTMTGSGAFIG